MLIIYLPALRQAQCDADHVIFTDLVCEKIVTQHDIDHVKMLLTEH
jgi:hypothetical protein